MTPKPMMIPAITLWQPWASWVAWGWKTIETRGHTALAGLRGKRIAIHAGQRWDQEAVYRASDFLTHEQLLRTVGPGARTGFPSGEIVCTARVSEARWLRAEDSPAALCQCGGTARFGLLLADVQQIAPAIPWRGSRLIWYLPLAVIPAGPAVKYTMAEGPA